MKGSENVLAGDESPATEAEDAARSFLARFAQADNPEGKGQLLKGAQSFKSQVKNVLGSKWPFLANKWIC